MDTAWTKALFTPRLEQFESQWSPAQSLVETPVTYISNSTVCIDAPFLVPEDDLASFRLKVGDTNRTTSDSPPQRTWWIMENGAYNGWKESLQSIVDILRENGPWHGLLGFSQGAVCVSLLLSILGNAETKNMFGQVPPLEFSILVSGFASRDPVHEIYLKNAISLPTMFVVGKEDKLVPMKNSEAMAENYTHSIIYRYALSLSLSISAGTAGDIWFRWMEIRVDVFRISSLTQSHVYKEGKRGKEEERRRIFWFFLKYFEMQALFARALQASTAKVGAQLLLERKKDKFFGESVVDLLWLHNQLAQETEYGLGPCRNTHMHIVNPMSALIWLGKSSALIAAHLIWPWCTRDWIGISCLILAWSKTLKRTREHWYAHPFIL